MNDLTPLSDEELREKCWNCWFAIFDLLAELKDAGKQPGDYFFSDAENEVIKINKELQHRGLPQISEGDASEVYYMTNEEEDFDDGT